MYLPSNSEMLVDKLYHTTSKKAIKNVFTPGEICAIIVKLILKRVDEVGNLRVSAPEKTALAVSGLQRVMRLSLRSAIREELLLA